MRGARRIACPVRKVATIWVRIGEGAGRLRRVADRGKGGRHAAQGSHGGRSRGGWRSNGGCGRGGPTARRGGGTGGSGSFAAGALLGSERGGDGEGAWTGSVGNVCSKGAGLGQSLGLIEGCGKWRGRWRVRRRAGIEDFPLVGDARKGRVRALWCGPGSGGASKAGLCGAACAQIWELLGSLFSIVG